MSSIRSWLLQNLVSQQTAGYAISVLFACCFTQTCFAVTKANTSRGYKAFPLTFLHTLLLNNHSDIANLITEEGPVDLRHPTISWVVR